MSPLEHRIDRFYSNERFPVGQSPTGYLDFQIQLGWNSLLATIRDDSLYSELFPELIELIQLRQRIVCMNGLPDITSAGQLAYVLLLERLETIDGAHHQLLGYQIVAEHSRFRKISYLNTGKAVDRLQLTPTRRRALTPLQLRVLSVRQDNPNLATNYSQNKARLESIQEFYATN